MIPWQLICTGKAASVTDLPASVHGNIEHTLKLNPGMKLRYFSDDECYRYIQAHFDGGLAADYRKEEAGHFRGDICRAAVLLREGGFYTDVDLETKEPFLNMVDGSTNFMSVFTADGQILNAMIAVVPGHPILNGTLREVRRWYEGTEGQKGLEEHGEGEWMGTVTLRRGIEAFMLESCPDSKLEKQREQLLSTQKDRWTCGSNVLRFYQEDRLSCDYDDGGNPKYSEECPQVRFESFFDGLKYGIFVPGTRKIVAWPRVATCTDWWCGGR